MYTSNPGASLIYFMFINCLIKLLLTIIFYFISFISFVLHLNWFNKIDIVICNVDRYGEIE